MFFFCSLYSMYVFVQCVCAFVCKCVGVQGLLEVCRQQRFYKCLLCIGINMFGLRGDELDLCEQFFIITCILKIPFIFHSAAALTVLCFVIFEYKKIKSLLDLFFDCCCWSAWIIFRKLWWGSNVTMMNNAMTESDRRWFKMSTFTFSSLTPAYVTACFEVQYDRL